MKLVEGDKFYFDERAADRAVKFIETYPHHYEDRWSGEPFRLLDWERQVVRDLFGWKRRDNHRRRFREAYIEIAKGNGKSPLLSVIGLYAVMAEGEEGAQVLSAATDYQQANVTFDCGKRMILNSPRLTKLVDAGRVEVLDREIRAPRNSTWRIVSGTAEGKHGLRPTVLLFDEAHEYPNRKLYTALRKNALKRSEPLIIVATNAGHDKTTVCWELHERAAKVLNGTSRDDTLYAVIYAAPDNADLTTDDGWLSAVKAANPALGEIITLEALRDEWTRARENPVDEADFRRLHLSQWREGTQKLLDMAAYDDCEEHFTADDVEGLPCIMGFDGSLNDDITALVTVWVGAEKLYVRARFWLPRATAIEYEDRNGISFTQWAAYKHIKLVEADTIDPQTQASIARAIIKRAKKYNAKAVCYDRARASQIIKLVEDAGITAVPVEQNWKLSPSVEELLRRMKDRSIVFYPNPVMRWNASNVEGAYDRKANVHIVKEARKGTYKGRSSQKIDGVQALVTALHQVRLEQMQPAQKPSVYETRGVFSI